MTINFYADSLFSDTLCEANSHLQPWPTKILQALVN